MKSIIYPISETPTRPSAMKWQLGLAGLFILMTVVATGLGLARLVDFHLEHFLAVLVLLTTVGFYLFQGLAAAWSWKRVRSTQSAEGDHCPENRVER
ncbi:hypothetical protein AB1L30_18330 [Bremerella sp. JC817]|uniref:hypothetical protein n=1 Tax=Bremerella sp. JC817 TaxID=3231756 RepID=UPI00345AD4ED